VETGYSLNKVTWSVTL